MSLKENPHSLLVAMQNGMATLEESQKSEIDLQYGPAISLIGIYPKESTSYSTDTCSPVFIASLLTIFSKWKQTKYPSTYEWIMKLWNIYTVE